MNDVAIGLILILAPVSSDVKKEELQGWEMLWSSGVMGQGSPQAYHGGKNNGKWDKPRLDWKILKEGKIAMNIPWTHILISKYHFLKKKQSSLEKLFPGLEWGKHNMSLKHLVVPESKEIKILKPIGRVSNWQNLGQFEHQIN